MSRVFWLFGKWDNARDCWRGEKGEETSLAFATHPSRGGRVGVARVTCVLYGVIIVDVDSGFTWEFR